LILTVGIAAAVAAPVDIMIGSRGYGFGGAYVAVAKDISAAYWNPAGLSAVEEITLMESNWIFQNVEGLNVNYVAFAMPIKAVGTIAVEWLLKHATLEYVDAEDNLQSSSANENTFSLSMGRTLFENVLFFEAVRLGLSINRHTFRTEHGNGAGFGFDAGLLTDFPYGFSLGFTARSLGADMEGEKLDPELRFGIGWSMLLQEMHRLTVDIDGTYKRNRDYEDIETLEPARNNLKYYGGLEYALVLNGVEIALRGGGNGALHNTLESYGFAAGAGVKYLGYSVQYAFKGDTDPDPTLGYAHRISLILELGNLWKK
jgi:hypothetical protein